MRAQREAQVDAPGDSARRGRGPTPNTDPDVPFRRADFDSLTAALDYAATGRSGLNFYSSRGQLEETLTYARLREDAIALGRRLMALGLERGDRVGVVADMHPDFVRGFFACQYAGLVAVPLPVPTALGGREGYEAQLQRVLQNCRAKVALTREGLLEPVHNAAAPLGLARVMTVSDLGEQAPADGPLSPLAGDEISHVQYSSGSTRYPLGIRIGQRALMSNAASVARDGLQMSEVERAASWLPFYHDMGLIGFLLIPLTCQISVDYMHTDGFARRPLQWLQLISDNRCTLAFSPTFGYELCVRRAAKKADLDLDLSCWRVAGIGGEMVRPEPLDEFARTFARHGFRPEAFVPSYGLAEATLAVSFAPLNTGVSVDLVDKEALVAKNVAWPVRTNGKAHEGEAQGTVDAHATKINGNGHAAKAGVNGQGANGHGANGHAGATAQSAQGHTDDHGGRLFAMCGVPMQGFEVAIRDDEGADLAERHIGRVLIKGPSLMDGYDHNPEATSRAMEDGWLDTGDMGYMVDGKLVITGRRKDLIIVNGRNIWPQDLEWHAEAALDELRSRDSAAFAVTDDGGREVAVLLVQCRTQEQAAVERMRTRVHAEVFRNTGIDCRVVMVPPRSLPFTTSGKLSRAKARQGYLEGRIADVMADMAAPHVAASAADRPRTATE
ncbi:AMP-binding protein [Limimonas halophila]|nr:AMP-binding protein [Limimonas halophila]